MDALQDEQLRNLQLAVARLEARVNYLFGALAVLVLLSNFLSAGVFAR